MSVRDCLGGCGRLARSEDYDLCNDCFLRLRDLVELAAAEVIAAAELILEEETA